LEATSANGGTLNNGPVGDDRDAETFSNGVPWTTVGALVCNHFKTCISFFSSQTSLFEKNIKRLRFI